MAKLEAHGIGGEALRWIDNWLTGRKQRVALNRNTSSWEDVESGVPQGSVLGPILFLVYINYLDGAARLVDILRKFADDTKASQRVGTANGRARLQVALDELCTWADKWGMEYNVKKCKVMHIGHGNIRHVYTMNG